MTLLHTYKKTITALVTGAIGWATMVVSSPAVSITGPEWIAGATFVAIGLGVYGAKNQ